MFGASVCSFDGGERKQVTEEIMEKILKVAVSDTSLEIRQSVLGSLIRLFDVYLSRAHHVQVWHGRALHQSRAVQYSLPGDVVWFGGVV